AYDLPLLMNPPGPGATFDVPNVDPLQERAQELASEVEKQADLLKQAIRDRLQPLLDPLSAGAKLVKQAVIYLVIPILAFLVISLAGGPFSAALLAAVDLIAKLNRLFAQQADLARNLSPELILEMLSNEMRELRDLLPDEFVREASA